MSLEKKIRLLLRADAVISWLVALPGLVDPAGVAMLFGVEEPTYGYLVRLWSGLLFLFGWASWEASGDVRAKLALLKYVWIGKAIVAVSVTVGHLAGEAPPSLMGLNVLTNVLWIPPILYGETALRRELGSA